MTSRSRDEVVVVTVSGKIDIFTARRVREALIEQIDAGRIHLVVDLGGVAVVDPTAVSVLIGVPWWRVHASGGCLALAGVTAAIRKVFHVSRGFAVYETAAEAVRACRSGRIGAPGPVSRLQTAHVEQVRDQAVQAHQ